jgi:hypothetical protein
MFNKILSLFKKDALNKKNIEVFDPNIQSVNLYNQLDFLSYNDFESILNQLDSHYQYNKISLLEFKTYFNERLKSLLEKMSITPFMEEIKFNAVYAHLNLLITNANFTDLEKKILNKQLNTFLTESHLSESIKLRILEIFSKHINFRLYNLNQLLTFNHFDLIYFIIENNLFDETIEINYNSFLLFNKNIKDLNYATLQVKRTKLGEFLKFLFQKYEGNQSKKDIELLIMNKVFSSGLMTKKSSIDGNFSLDNIHKKDFLIPVHLLEVFEQCSSMKEVIVNFFGLYNRRLEKLVINAFFKDSHINYDIFAWGLLIQPLKINIDIISNHLENKDYPNRLYQINDIESYNLSILKKFYNDKRILKIIANITKEDIPLFKDTLNMTDIVSDFNIKSDDNQKIKKLIKKPKSIKELHDFLSVLTTQIKQRNFSLPKQEELLSLEFSIRKEGLSIKIPTMNHDLIEIGQKLNICVGGGHYADKIKNEKCLILTIFKNSILTYCIEIHPESFEILQAKGAFNAPVPKKDLDWIKEKLEILNHP